MDQVIESPEVRVVIDNRLRLLVLYCQEHVVRSYEFIDKTLLFLAESYFRQQLYSISRRHWRKIRAVDIADFDCPGEPALKCKDDRLSRERPIPDYQNDRDCRSDRDKSSDDQAPAQQR